MTTPTFEVQLAVYDLSHGMARQLSAQFLGGPQYAIDIIPHTGIVVHGQEYFFGGGIQHQSPQVFRQSMGIFPVQTLILGRTTKTKAEFDQWCAHCTNSGRYTMASYDLLNRNCNNFCHDAAVEGLGLPQSVFPQWILEVPQKFLSSPMGQLVRPMLENMQLGVGGGGGGAGMGRAPFANAPTNTFNHSGSSASSGATTTATTSAASIDNPWANIPATTAASSEKKEPANSPSKETSKGTPVLDSFCKPLISSDSKTVGLCIKKLIGAVEDEKDKETLETTGQILSTTTTNNTNGNKRLTSDQVEEACRIVCIILSQAPSTTTFALMFLRVLILESTTGQESSLEGCIHWIQSQLIRAISSISDGEEASPLATSHAARSMAWLTLANAASLSWWPLPAAQDDTSSSSSTSLLEAAMSDLSIILQPQPAVRQAAAAFCYNSTLSKGNNNDDDDGKDLSDDSVSLLCASLENIENETDPTTRLRRLLVAARILVPAKTKTTSFAVKLLMNDLGFVEVIQELSQDDNNLNNNKGAEQCQKLAQEVLGLLQD